MIRAILFRLWPVLLLILVLWVGYWFIFKKRKGEDALPPWQTKLWLWTTVIMLFSLLFSIVVMVSQFDSNPSATYEPARVEDGEIVPGKLVPSNDSNR